VYARTHLQQAEGCGAQELGVLVRRLDHGTIAQAVNQQAANLPVVP
jgi:hypothetical protein